MSPPIVRTAVAVETPSRTRQRLAAAGVAFAIAAAATVWIGDPGTTPAAAPDDDAPAVSAADAGLDARGNTVLPHSDHGSLHGSQLPVAGKASDPDNATLLNTIKATPYAPGTVKEFNIQATEKTVEIVKGVNFRGWTFNGTIPGPIIRVTEGDIVKVNFTNRSSHPHSMHFHGNHQASMDGVEDVVLPGKTFTYQFVAGPAGMHLYHCHAVPLKKHVHKGMYGAFIVDPKTPRPAAKEMVMVMNAFDVNGDTDNDFYGVNTKAFLYAKYPINVKRGELVRVYLGNMTEFDPVNSFHLHGGLFKYFPTGTTSQYNLTDTVTLGQGERGVIEMRFPHTGRYMFHAHQTELGDLGWMGFFNVTK